MKRTYQPSTIKGKKRHGFLARLKKRPHILAQRRFKGRKVLAR